MKTARHLDAITLGEGLVLLTEVDSSGLEIGKLFSASTGGAESNVAIGLARLGSKVLWASALGSDVFGDLVNNTLLSQGVQTQAGRVENASTGHMIKFSNGFLDPSVVYGRKGSAASSLGPESYKLTDLPTSRLLHISGVFAAISESAYRLCHQLMTAAQQSGVLVSFDINYRPQLWGTEAASEKLRALAALADVVFGGESELALISGQEAFTDDLAEALALGLSAEVVVKRGSKGASLFHAGIWLDVLPHKIMVVDTVGAGDAFVAGYLSQVLKGANYSDRLAVGNYCGARACEHRGDWEGMVNANELARAELNLPRVRKARES